MAAAFGKTDLDAENQLSDFFELLKDEVYVMIETPYVDRVHRNTYYSYFLSKHNPYPKDCIRVNFFNGKIVLADFQRGARRSSLQAGFLGFMVIRPTYPNVIGRTLIDPRAYTKQDFQICRYTVNVSVNGIKLDVQGFPFSSRIVRLFPARKRPSLVSCTNVVTPQSCGDGHQHNRHIIEFICQKNARAKSFLHQHLNAETLASRQQFLELFGVLQNLIAHQSVNE